MTTNTLKKNTKVHIKGTKTAGIIVNDIYGDGQWYGIRLPGESLLRCAFIDNISIAK